MQINKAIRNVMKAKGVSLNAMGSSLRKVDRKTGEMKPLIGNDVSARLTNQNLTFDIAVEMLNVLGYEVVIQENIINYHWYTQIISLNLRSYGKYV